ncbi:DUF3219 family protein [Sediminibacillus massiliensis]|uniref:DUF3219 family protein n=1 Tax=Sediminibacillus massiliensis TaxID=1926277 RepID=UPI00098885F1|nr:DUF3219 family protein [Sediminibacillus massiliensis]
MTEHIIINGLSIEGENFLEEKRDKGVELKRKISFDFKVRHEEYHQVTTTLYEKRLQVEVPNRGLDFPAIIHAYSTSLTNLYEENAVGTFHLELVEDK